ncbi:unnamed protein product [Nezara viridula]|uniref:Uncharacterized protein n=1 Tax=Nezara viridula TaxID=85310 RepID=A0A9P0HRP4_NEZVI|nr:unnamed protein product [Nezara viridula]
MSSSFFLYHEGGDVLRNDSHSGGPDKPSSEAHLVPLEQRVVLALAGWSGGFESDSSALVPCRERIHVHRCPPSPRPPLNTPFRHFFPSLGSSPLQTDPSSRSYSDSNRGCVLTEKSKEEEIGVFYDPSDSVWRREDPGEGEKCRSGGSGGGRGPEERRGPWTLPELSRAQKGRTRTPRPPCKSGAGSPLRREREEPQKVACQVLRRADRLVC